jgi:hypothetical protein
MNVKNKTGRVRTAYLSGVDLPGTLWKWYAERTLQTYLHPCRHPAGEGVYTGSHKPINRIFAALLFLALGILADPAYALITCGVTTTSVNFGVYTTTSNTPMTAV